METRSLRLSRSTQTISGRQYAEADTSADGSAVTQVVVRRCVALGALTPEEVQAFSGEIAGALRSDS